MKSKIPPPNRPSYIIMPIVHCYHFNKHKTTTPLSQPLSMFSYFAALERGRRKGLRNGGKIYFHAKKVHLKGEEAPRKPCHSFKALAGRIFRSPLHCSGSTIGIGTFLVARVFSGLRKAGSVAVRIVERAYRFAILASRCMRSRFLRCKYVPYSRTVA